MSYISLNINTSHLTAAYGMHVTNAVNIRIGSSCIVTALLVFVAGITARDPDATSGPLLQ